MTVADIRVSIDRGGTFCDVIAHVDGREPIIFKLLSVDPANYQDAPTEGIRRVLEIVEGRKIPMGEKLDGARIGAYLLPRHSHLLPVLPNCGELNDC
jgi:5-oxoprolinase (ATP-hydrolysing)